MRRSPLQHPLAVLRTTLGLGQKDFGKLVGRSWRTIQSIELGTLPLSPKLAEAISDQTGINFHWLMKGDPNADMITEHGGPWHAHTYFDAQGRKRLPGTVAGQHYATDLFMHALAHICAAVIASAESKNIRSHLWRFLNAIDNTATDLKAYSKLLEGFTGIIVDNRHDTQAACDQMLACALKRIRATREPRPKRPTPAKPKKN